MQPRDIEKGKRTLLVALAIALFAIALDAAQQPGAPGDVTFTPPAGAVLYYEARAYAEGTTTPILASQYLGVPDADPISGRMKVNVATMLNALPAGNYDLIVAAVGVEGVNESAHETAIALPLQP